MLTLTYSSSAAEDFIRRTLTADQAGTQSIGEDDGLWMVREWQEENGGYAMEFAELVDFFGILARVYPEICYDGGA